MDIQQFYEIQFWDKQVQEPYCTVEAKMPEIINGNGRHGVCRQKKLINGP